MTGIAEVGGFYWTLLTKHADLYRFVSLLRARRFLRNIENERQRISVNAIQWRRWIDTGLDSPDDIVSWTETSSVADNHYSVMDRSVVMLIANAEGSSS